MQITWVKIEYKFNKLIKNAIMDDLSFGEETVLFQLFDL